MAPPGWHTGTQIRTHQLAASIINYHGRGDDLEVLDTPSLDLLQRFCASPSTATRDTILAERGWVDAPGDRPGAKAGERDGDLVGFCIARYGTSDPAFDDRDLEMLREWFERGRPVGENVQR